MKKCVYPGSFDPISNGHVDIIKRAAKLFDEVHVVVATNINKKTTFTAKERMEMVADSVKNIKNVVVTEYDGLVVQYCKENNIDVIVRGMRNFSDYESEFALFQYNRDIYPGIETIILMPTTRLQMVSSSSIKELITFGVDISKYVPSVIVDRVVAKYSK
ncbi:MAG: pantetheine-phosphate adenylyltransferase [Acholeplasmatales bacterium]|nr:pantetheine-phosphate adenylyltransferase [Acholeplasmatales bacterium]